MRSPPRFDHRRRIGGPPFFAGALAHTLAIHLVDIPLCFLEAHRGPATGTT